MTGQSCPSMGCSKQNAWLALVIGVRPLHVSGDGTHALVRVYSKDSGDR